MLRFFSHPYLEGQKVWNSCRTELDVCCLPVGTGHELSHKPLFHQRHHDLYLSENCPPCVRSGQSCPCGYKIVVGDWGGVGSYMGKSIITQRFYLQKAVLERILGGNKNMSSFYGHSAILLQQEHAFNSLLKSLLGYNMDFKTSLSKVLFHFSHKSVHRDVGLFCLFTYTSDLSIQKHYYRK